MAEMHLTNYLRIWQKHFDPDIPKTFMERVWVKCHGNKFAVLIGVVVFTLNLLDCIMARSSILDAGPPIRFFTGVYAGTAAVFYFTFRRATALRAINQILRVLVAVEGNADDKTKESMRRYASRYKKWLRATEAYCGFVFLSVMVPAALTGKPANPTWPEPTTPLGRYALLTVHMFSTIFLPAGFFPLFAFIGTIQGICTILYRALGSRLEKAAGLREVREVAEMLTWLNEGASLVCKEFFELYVHLMLPSLLIPLFGVYEVFNGQVDPFLFALAPLNVAVFVPLCFSGQALADVSSSLSECAYNGDWLEEELQCKRLRLQVMQRAARPTQPASRQLGPVNLALCQAAVRSWFSYLNVLLNTANRK